MATRKDSSLRLKNQRLEKAYEELKAAQAQIIAQEKLEYELSLARQIQMQKRVAEEKQYDVIVNCTPLGMKGFPQEMSISPHVLREGQFVMDTVYNPPVTPLLAEASRKGAKAVNGRDMLIYQALASFELWTGKAAEYDVMERAFREALP